MNHRGADKVYVVDNPDQACIVAIDVLIGLGEMDASKIVYLTNINWTLYRGMPFRVPSNHFAGEIFKNIAYKIGGEKAEKRIENFINSYIVALWAPIQLKMGTKNPNKVFKKLIEEESGKRTTLKKYNDLRETINGTQGLILFADLELFDPPSSKGLPGEIPQQLNEKISNARVQGKKIVYLTMGSTGDNVVINSIIKFFESETKGNYFLIFNHGNQEDVDYSHFSSVNPLVSDKMFITDFLPGEKIIPLTDMVIFHGGSTTFWQVVSAGINSLDNKKNKVPGLIVISTHIDQEDIGRHVENHQLGAHFTAKHIKRFVTENSLLLKMEEVLNESITFENNFRLLCQKLKEGGYNPNNVGAAAAAIIHQKYLINND